MAGIQDHHIRTFGGGCRRIAQRCQNICHPVGIIDIHLTAISLDEQFLGHARGFRFAVNIAGVSMPDTAARVKVQHAASVAALPQHRLHLAHAGNSVA